MPENKQCMICGKVNAILHNQFDMSDCFIINCTVCGNYKISMTLALSGLKERSDLYILSGIIKNATKQNNIITVTTENIDKLIKLAPIPQTVTEHIELVIKFLGDRAELLFDEIETDSETEYSALFFKNELEYCRCLYACEQLGYLSVEDGSAHSIRMQIKGWEKYDEIRKEKPLFPKRVFMAMRYGDIEHENIYNIHFKEAVKNTGFYLERLDERPSAGLIDNRLRVEIRNCRFLLADLSGENRGAYWEAGYAEGLGKQVIYLCREDEFKTGKVHFDTNHHTTIIYNENNIEKAKEDLKATIRASFPSEASMIDIK